MPLRRYIKRMPEKLPAIVLVAASGWGIYQGITVAAGDWDSIAALILLLVATAVHALRRLPNEVINRYFGGWVLLIAAFAAIVLFRTPVGKNAALLLGCGAVTVYCGGWRSLRLTGLPLGIALVLLPFQEALSLIFSYPLRLISTGLSVGALKLFGVQISSELTTIYAGDAEIAITDACSGVTQLGVLLFFAYLLALQLQSWPVWRKAAWGLFILPSVILANTVRLLILIGLFFMIGDAAFDTAIHVGLGYLFVILSLLIWRGCAGLFAPASPAEQKEEVK